ncbi:MAG: hypothetical protein IKJ06_00235 [Clostridia bacterium]|nr:hypothetical protein [Clostridia bacterium]
MQKKQIQNIFNFVSGVLFCFGLCMTLWLIIGAFLDNMFEINNKNTLFLLITVIVPWFINFVFGYTSKLYAKGILHGVLWFVLDVIVFNLMYGIALEAKTLLYLAITFAIVYALILFGFSRISNKLNIPVRHFADFCSKLLSSWTKN